MNAAIAILKWMVILTVTLGFIWGIFREVIGMVLEHMTIVHDGTLDGILLLTSIGFIGVWVAKGFREALDAREDG